jgi:hypothetical protein
MAAESGSSCSDSSDWSSGSSDDEADCWLSHQLVNEKGKESEDSDSTSLDHTELEIFADGFEVNWLVRLL